MSFSESERKTLGNCPKNFWLSSLNWKWHIQGIKFYHISWCSITHFVSFRLLAGVFWRVYRNCFLRALRIVLTEEKFSRTKKSFSKEFRILSKKNLHFRQTKSAGMPNFCSISPKEQFEENNAEKKNIFISISDIDWKTLGSCPEKFGYVL